MRNKFLVKNTPLIIIIKYFTSNSYSFLTRLYRHSYVKIKYDKAYQFTNILYFLVRLSIPNFLRIRSFQPNKPEIWRKGWRATSSTSTTATSRACAEASRTAFWGRQTTSTSFSAKPWKVKLIKWQCLHFSYFLHLKTVTYNN